MSDGGRRSFPASTRACVRRFIDAGLLRQIPVDGSKALSNTDARDQHHFLVESSNDLIDAHPSELTIDKIPIAPDGFEIAKSTSSCELRARRHAMRDRR
jgi:Fur family iron response transcriptional regulator